MRGGSHGRNFCRGPDVGELIDVKEKDFMGSDMDPTNLVEGFQLNHHYEDTFYLMCFNSFSSSRFIKKIIIDRFILTQWTD